MNWTVIWLDDALNELAATTAAVWGTPLSDTIVRTMARADQILSSDAAGAGESRPGHERFMVDLPLAFEFEVYPEHRTAVVTRVRFIRKRS
jgi:hypothetical protein